MVTETRLHDAFGELIYCVAIADGLIDEQESEKLKELLQDHPWGAAVQWSFDYEKKKQHSIKDTYAKALDTLKENGPHPEYASLVSIMEQIAEASNGVDRTEGRVITNMQQSLRSHFINYLNDNKLL